MHLKLNWASKLFEEVVLCRSYVKKNLLRKKDKKKKLKKIKKKIVKKQFNLTFQALKNISIKYLMGPVKKWYIKLKIRNLVFAINSN